MKLTKSKLKQLIKEELTKMLNERPSPRQVGAAVLALWITKGQSAAIAALEKAGVLQCLRKSPSTSFLADEVPDMKDIKLLRQWFAKLPDECGKLLGRVPVK